jgi:hypothetical protein
MDDFDGMQISQYALIHLTELANHIRQHGINWHARTYEMYKFRKFSNLTPIFC